MIINTLLKKLLNNKCNLAFIGVNILSVVYYVHRYRIKYNKYF